VKSDALLEVKGLSKSFPGVNALDRVDFRLENGSVHAVCGENGAGKSTLMNVLMGSMNETPEKS
jgi:ABC-type sugar transport system ATPase subunit